MGLDIGTVPASSYLRREMVQNIFLVSGLCLHCTCSNLRREMVLVRVQNMFGYRDGTYGYSVVIYTERRYEMVLKTSGTFTYQLLLYRDGYECLLVVKYR